MNAPAVVQHDERTVAVAKASYRLAYLFLSFGLLAVVAVRSLVYAEAPWDLLLLAILGGGIGTAYQGRFRVLSRHWMIATVLAVGVALGLAVLIVLLRR